MTSHYPLDTVTPKLKGKVITITGAASGIGLATAHAAACSGAHLAISDVQPIQPVVEELTRAYEGVKVVGTQVDIRNYESVESWIKSTVQEFGHIDGCANVAGVLGMKGQPPFAPIRDYSVEQFEFIMAVNAVGMFNCLKAELLHISEGGSIINVSSAGGLTATPGICAYGASKAAVVSLTKSAAREEGKRGIRVNAVCPGAIETPMTSMQGAQAGGQAVLSRQAIPRMGSAPEVGALMAFLLSDQSTFITGSTYSIDGGYTA